MIMARPVRIDVENGWYHVMSRGIERRDIFGDDRDRGHFLDLLADTTERYNVGVHAFVLMDNHYHLLLQTPEANASRAMQWLNVSYASWFNARRSRVGHLFQGRFKSTLIDGNGSWLLLASVYIHLNPVNLAGLALSKTESAAEARGFRDPTKEQVVERLKKLRTFRWSSYRAYGRYAGTPEWLRCTELLHRAGGREAYRRYVQQHVTRGMDPDTFSSFGESVAIGKTEFLDRARSIAKGLTREHCRRDFLKDRPGLDNIIAAVEQVKGEDWKEFRGRYGDSGRDVVFYLAKMRCGLTYAELGSAAGEVEAGTVAQSVFRLKHRLKKDKLLASLVKQCIAQM